MASDNHHTSGPPPTRRVMFRAEPIAPTVSDEQRTQEWERGFDHGRQAAKLDYLHPCYEQGVKDALLELADSPEWLDFINRRTPIVSAEQGFACIIQDSVLNALREKVEGVSKRGEADE